MHAKLPQSCPTLCDPVDCRLPGFSIRGILQARILEWVAISFSRGSSPPRDRTRQADTLLSEPPGNLQNEDIQLDPLDPSRAKSLCLYVKVFDAFPLIA